MPVFVGVILALIVLVSFSGWFYNLISGWNDYILDDVYFKYRIGFASLVTILVISGTFIGMSYALECPDQSSEGIIPGLSCEKYNSIKTATGEVINLPKTENKVNTPINPDELSGESVFGD